MAGMITVKAHRSLPTSAMLRLAILVIILQLQLSLVTSQRERLRGDNLYVRQERNSNRIHGGYQRPDRGNNNRPNNSNNRPNNNQIKIIPPPSNNNNNNNLQATPPPELLPPPPPPTTPNLVLVPQCDPTDPISLYNSNNARQDKTSDCDRYTSYCGKKHSELSYDSWSNFVYPNDFYETVELLFDRCLATCSQEVGGIQEFCKMPDPPPQNPIDENYCFDVLDEVWGDELIAEEKLVLQALNDMRNKAEGSTCRRYRPDENGAVTVYEAFFPRASPVVLNSALTCASRILAKNIVEQTLQNGRFPSNLHNACPSRDGAICEAFTVRMEKAGYGYSENGYGYTNEVTAAGYRSAKDVVRGWKQSKTGHCEAILKQESKVVPTEVGVGYYRDPVSGWTGHVVISAQRNL